jgi:hypothetical protein
MKRRWLPRMGSTQEPGSGGEEQAPVMLAQYFWEEFKYRHDLVWRLLFKVTTAAIALSIAPFAIEEFIARQVEPWARSLPFLAAALVLGSVPLFLTEIRLLNEVLEFHLKSQNRLLSVLEVTNEWVHDPEKRKLFDWLVPLYLIILFLASLIVGGIVVCGWDPSPEHAAPSPAGS